MCQCEENQLCQIHTHTKTKFSFFQKKKKSCWRVFVSYPSNSGIQILYICWAHLKRKERYREFLIKMYFQQDLKYTTLKYKARTLLSKLNKFSEYIQGTVMVSGGSLWSHLEFYRRKSKTHLRFSRWVAEIRMEPIFLSRIYMHTDYREGRLKASFSAQLCALSRQTLHQC